MPKQPPKAPSTQEHLPFTAVFQDTLVLKDGNFRKILLVSSINFGLKSEEEQNAILYAYQSFLNSLTFPAQILTQSRQIDLSEYLAKLQKMIYQQTNELIRYQTQEYIDFISRLISVANIMDKKFFVVVPYTKTNLKTGFFAPRQGSLQVSLTEFQKIKDELDKRIEVVQQGLASLGIKTAILTTDQIIDLLYASYNITQSMREKLQNPSALAEETVKQVSSSTGQTPQQPPQQPGAQPAPPAVASTASQTGAPEAQPSPEAQQSMPPAQPQTQPMPQNQPIPQAQNQPSQPQSYNVPITKQ